MSTEVSIVHPTSTLLPFSSSTAPPTVPATRLSPISTAIPTVSPTATPFIHVVRKDDTLLGIAYRYGVSMDDILVANPGIDSRILSIDQEIIIPMAEGESITNISPTATPIPLHLSEVACHSSPAPSFWCISTLENDGEYPLEAVSVVISLRGENDVILVAMTAYSPLNLIPRGSKFPLAVNFSEFTGEYAYAMVSPVSAFPARSVDERFIPIEVIRDEEVPSEDFTSWRVGGRLVSKDTEGRSTNRIAILVIALDEDDQIVGFRKLKFNTELRPGEELNFETEVFSLGPAIQKIEIYAEGPVSVEED